MKTSERLARPAHITDLHVERGEQLRKLVATDVVRQGYSFEQAVDELARFLGIERESVLLGIAIANEWGVEE